MVKQLNERCLSCQIYVVMVFLALLRAMGLTCRLVSSLQVKLRNGERFSLEKFLLSAGFFQMESSKRKKESERIF